MTSVQILTGAILFLVGIVQTVVVAVAHPRFGYAPHVVARKVPRVRTSRHRRLGIRVGHARFTVRRDLLPVRASALGYERCRRVRRYRETQFLTSPVVGDARTRVTVVHQLFVFAVYFHAV